MGLIAEAVSSTKSGGFAPVLNGVTPLFYDGGLVHVEGDDQVGNVHALKLEGAPCDRDFGQHEVSILVAEMPAQDRLVFRIGEIDSVLHVAPGQEVRERAVGQGVRRLLAGHGGPPLAGGRDELCWARALFG